jgi:hypothetical protein
MNQSFPLSRVYNRTTAEVKIINENIRFLQEWKDGPLPTLVRSIGSFDKSTLFRVSEKGRGMVILSNLAQERTQVQKKLELIQKRVKEINEMYEGTTARTGRIQFNISFVNQGDGDGTVDPRGRLMFNNVEVKLMTEGNKAMKAHSIEEIIYELNEQESDPNYLSVLTNILRAKRAIPYMIIIPTGGKEEVQFPGKFI